MRAGFLVGAGVRGLGPLGELRGLAPYDDNRGHGGGRGGGPEGEADGAGCLAEGVAGVVGGEAVDGGPQDAAGGVAEEETRPPHPVDAGQHGGVRPEHRNEPAEKDDLAAVAIEDVPPDLQLRFVNADIMAVLTQETVTAGATDPEADVIAQDRGGRSRSEDNPRGQLMGVTGIASRQDKSRFPGHRYTDALGADKKSDGEISVGDNEVAHASVILLISLRPAPAAGELATNVREIRAVFHRPQDLLRPRGVVLRGYSPRVVPARAMVVFARPVISGRLRVRLRPRGKWRCRPRRR